MYTFHITSRESGDEDNYTSYPLELINLDFVMIGTRNDHNKNMSVLIVVDHFTRYAAAYIMSKQTALVVAKVLWENFLVNYGWPEKILTDEGKNFKKFTS